MYGLYGKMKTHPGKRDEMIAHLMRGIEFLNQMEGCYTYIIASATDDPDTIWITEVWRSQDDHQASLANEGIRAIITAARPLIAEISGGFEVVPHGGKGLLIRP